MQSSHTEQGQSKKSGHKSRKSQAQPEPQPAAHEAPDSAPAPRHDDSTRPLWVRVGSRDRGIALALWLLLFCIYLGTSGFRVQSIDEVLTFTTTRSLIGRGTLDSDIIYWAQPEGNRGGSVVTGIDGHSYVVKDIGPSLLIVPLVWLADLIKVISPFRAAMLLSPILTALTAALLYLLARLRGYAVPPAVAAALTFGLGTLAWPYAESLFTQPLAALGLLLAMAGAILAVEQRSRGYALLSGIGMGIASISAIPTLVTLPIYPLFLIPWGSLRDGSWRAKLRETTGLIVAFGLGIAPFGLLHAVLDQAHFGSPFITSYHASRVDNALQLSNLGVAGYGLLHSTPRGLLWYVPLVILIPFGVWLGWKARRREMLLAGAQAVLTIGFYSTYTEWWGGNAWGPRLFLPLMPALIWLIAPLAERLSKPSAWWLRALALLPVAASALMQGLATVFNVILTERRFYDDLISVRLSPTFLADYPVLTDPASLPWQRLAAVMRRGQWDTLWMSRGAPDWALIAAWSVLIVLAAVWFVLALRQKTAGWLRWAMLGQVALALVAIGFALTRYPRIASDYVPDETPPHADLDQAISLLSGSATRDDEIVTLLPYSYLLWLDRTDGSVHDTGFRYEQPLRGLTERRLTQIQGETGRVWLVTEKVAAGDTTNGVEAWLAGRAFAGVETVFGDYRVVPYTFPSGPINMLAQDKLLGPDGIHLDTAGFELVEQPRSEWLNVWLRWDTSKQIPRSATVFVHVLSEEGLVAAQHDGLPGGGYAPTQTWQPGETIEDRHSIAIDLTLPAGMYRVSVGMYDTLTGDRLPMPDGSDTIAIGTIEIR